MKDLHEPDFTSTREVKDQKEGSVMIEVRTGLTYGSVWGIDRKHSMREFSGAVDVLSIAMGVYMFFKIHQVARIRYLHFTASEFQNIQKYIVMVGKII